MSKLELTKSVRKFIRMEKARIRRQFFDINKQKEMINELYKKIGVSKGAPDKSPLVEAKPEIKAVKKTSKKVATKK